MKQTDKEYIRPYKQMFLSQYNDCVNRYKQAKDRDSKIEIFKDLVFYMQVRSGTNQYRVNLIKDFEHFLIKRFLKIISKDKRDIYIYAFTIYHCLVTEMRKGSSFATTV